MLSGHRLQLLGEETDVVRAPDEFVEQPPRLGALSYAGEGLDEPEATWQENTL